jgi:hypothetical protein
MAVISSENQAIAVVFQPTVDLFVTPTAADRIPCANISWQKSGVKIPNPEYAPGKLRNPDQLIGQKVTISFDIFMRPPGGVSPPALGAWLPGRFLVAGNYTENRVGTAITESLGGVSTTTKVILGATALGTVGLYTGLAISLGTGTYGKKLSAIRSYGVDVNGVAETKAAHLCRPYSPAPTGSSTIPAQLGYHQSIDGPDPSLLSLQYWVGGKRYDLVNCRVSNIEHPLQTTTPDGGEYPSFKVTCDVEIAARADEAAPQVAASGTIPPFRDGQNWLANFAIGGNSVSINIGLETSAFPDPNKKIGARPTSLDTFKPVMTYDLENTLISELDKQQLAEDQTPHAWMAQWGYGPGTTIVMSMPNNRFDIPNEGTGGSKVTETGEMYAERRDRPISIAIPY